MGLLGDSSSWVVTISKDIFEPLSQWKCHAPDFFFFFKFLIRISYVSALAWCFSSFQWASLRSVWLLLIYSPHGVAEDSSNTSRWSSFPQTEQTRSLRPHCISPSLPRWPPTDPIPIHRTFQVRERCPVTGVVTQPLMHKPQELAFCCFPAVYKMYWFFSFPYILTCG